jgi:hypothetical protein
MNIVNFTHLFVTGEMSYGKIGEQGAPEKAKHGEENRSALQKFHFFR